MYETIFDIISQKFTSGNSVPVDRAIITADEYQQILDKYAAMRKVAKESQGWDWLSAYEYAEDNGLVNVDISAMQELIDAVDDISE